MTNILNIFYKSLTIISMLLLSSCSNINKDLDAFERNYDFDVYGKLKVAAWFEEEQPLTQVVNSFNERYPNVEVEIIYFPSQSYHDYLDTITDVDEGFDVVLLPAVYLYSTLKYEEKIVDLMPYIENDSIQLDVFGTILNDIRTDDYIYALPYRNSVFLLYYNKTLFDQAGLSYPDSSFTWEKFISYARELTVGEGEDKIWGAFIQNYIQLWTLSATQDGSNYLDDDLSSFESSIEMMLSMVKDGITMSPKEIVENDLVQNGSVKIFGSGKVAMMPMGEWTVRQLLELEQLTFEWAVAEMPYPQGGRRNVTIGNPSLVTILESADNKTIAFEFIKTLSGPSGASIYAKTGSIPALITETTRDLYLKDKNPNLNLHLFLEAQTEMFSPDHPKSFEITNLFKQVFSDVLNQKTSLTKAMEKLYLERVKIYQHD